jgi:endonuclease YncB( thermonuclease family)
MRLSYNKSRPGLTDNPEGCKEGKLLNEEMVKAGLAEVLNFKGRGELKYEARIRYVFRHIKR